MYQGVGKSQFISSSQNDWQHQSMHVQLKFQQELDKPNLKCTGMNIVPWDS